MIKLGTRIESNNFGMFTVIDYLGNNRYLIKFDNTGSTTTAFYEAIRKGRVRDKFAPVVAGVGYTGTFDGVISKPENIIFYRAWNDMLHRCYDPTDKDYPMYGAIGVRVDPAWFNFGTYFKDIQEIPGFEMKLRYPDQYQLDKDLLQQNVPKSQRIYSKNTCIWISKFDNISIMNDIGASGYRGVIYKDNSHIMRYKNRCYGRYTNPEAAAVAYNYCYMMNNTRNIFCAHPVINHNVNMTIEESTQYLKNPKEMCKIVSNT